jgi:hypothetical protein
MFQIVRCKLAVSAESFVQVRLVACVFSMPTQKHKTGIIGELIQKSEKMPGS